MTSLSPQLGDILGGLSGVRLGEVEAVQAPEGAEEVHHVGVVQDRGEHAGHDDVGPGAAGDQHPAFPDPAESDPGAQHWPLAGEAQSRHPDCPHQAAGTRADNRQSIGGVQGEQQSFDVYLYLKLSSSQWLASCYLTSSLVTALRLFWAVKGFVNIG